MNLIVQILSSKNWLPYFKPIARAFNDNNPAILLSELANQYQFYESKEGLDSEGYFYCSADKLEVETCLSRHKQTKALNLLSDAGLIEIEIKGIPAVKHFRFPKDFQNKFSNFLKTGLQKNAKQGCKKFKTNEKRSNEKRLLKTDNKDSEAEASALVSTKKINHPKVKTNHFSNFDNPEKALSVWQEWEKYKKSEKRQRYKTEQSLLVAIENLYKISGGKSDTAGEIVKTSIANLWQGLFQLKQQQPQKTNGKIIDSSKYAKYA